MSIDTIFIGKKSIIDEVFSFGENFQVYHDIIWNNFSLVNYFKLIDWWNTYLKQFANERNIPILKVSEILNKGGDFENDIEPSNKGGKILSKAIYEKAYKK